jgi:hypothetical protein
MNGLTLDKEILVETIPFIPKVGEYGLYSDGKIWFATSSEGAGKNYKIVFERETSKEKLVLKGFTEELKQMNKIIKPSGYIKL